MILEDLGPVVVLETPRDQSPDVHGGRMNRRGHFFSRHEEKVFPRFAFEFDRGGIDELVVLAENEKVVSAVVIPLGNRIGFGIGMTAKSGVHMGVSLVPLVGPRKKREKKQKVERADGHGSKLHELPKSVNDGHGDLRTA